MGSKNDYLPTGSIIRGVYQVESTVGIGYTAVIYKCRDCRTSRTVAVKRFFPKKIEPRFREKAYAEVQLKISGEYFVLGEEVFEEDGHLHLVMPFVEGTKLSDCLEEPCCGSDGVAVVYITMCLTRACSELHAGNILSTDIKPENVMILNNGVAKLIDLTFFEIAGQKAIVSQGTEPYAARELLCHDYLWFSTDLFSIGVVLVEMLMGSRKFNEVSKSWEQAIRAGKKPDISCINHSYPELAKIVSKTLEPNPHNRYRTAQELFSHLSAYYASTSGVTIPNEKKLVFACNNGVQVRLPQGRFFIGRNDIDCKDMFISEKHLEVDFDGTRVKVRDTRSTNGTWLNGAKTNGRWRRINENDVLYLADVSLKLKLPR